MDRISRTASYHFGRLVVDISRGVMTVDGLERPLRAKSFALLVFLVERADELVGRDEIMKAVWAGVTVDDDVIVQSIRDIRRATDDHDHRLVRTMHRRGYMFVSPETDRQLLPADAAGANILPRPLSGRPILLVHPFSAVIGGERGDYFTIGLTADLVADLTHVQELHVISPLSRLIVPDVDPAADATYVLVGSVQRDEGRIRVVARLSERATGRILWSERFDRSLVDIFAIQAELAGLITAAVDVEIEQDGLRRSREKAPENLTAYDFYLQGRDLFVRGNAADAASARDLFHRAISADRSFAPSYAYQSYIALRGFTLSWGAVRGQAALHSALAFADRAVDLAPRSPLSIMRRAFVLSVLSRDDEAIERGSGGVRLNPSNADSRATQGEILSRAGHHIEGAAELSLAMSLNPFHTPVWNAAAGRALLFAGCPEEGLLQLKRATALAPDYSPSHSSLVMAHVEAGRIDEARASLGEVLRIKPHAVIRDHRAVCGLRRREDLERFCGAFRAAGLPE